MNRAPRPSRHWPTPVLILGVLAAGGCDTSPTAPPGPTVPVSAVVISPAADTVAIGASLQFTAVVYDTAGNPTGGAPLWKSGDVSVFTVNALGRVTGVGEGTADLIATAGGQADTAQVTVLPGGGWFLQASGTTASLHGVFFIGSTGWAVGDAGTIVRTTDAGAHWSRVTATGTSFSLNGVWFTSLSEGWAVGQSGTVLRSTNGGVTWARLGNVGQGETLTDVHFATRDTGWVVGANGLVLRTFDRGASWNAFRVPTTFALNGVAFSGTRDGWAVGGGGVIAGTHDRGVTWFTVPSLTSQPIKAVSRPEVDFAFAVGSQGVTPRTITTPDSVAWEMRNAGVMRQLEGVHYVTRSIGYAVGFDASLGGAVLRTDDGGLSWEAQASHTGSRLDDVYFIDELRGWAVGEGGTIIHTGRGGKP